MNAVEIEEAISLLAEQPFNPDEFPYAFLEAFGNKATTIRRLQTGNNNKSDVEGGVLQRNNIHIAVCEKGAVLETLNRLRESPATSKAKAKFILATDGKEFQAEDMSSGETVACDYQQFNEHFGFFLPLAGISTVKQIRENAFDIRATARLNKLYVELLRHNPDWDTEERRHDMNHFLARLIFCFFAEDTGIFSGNNPFVDTIQRTSASDASDTHEVMSEIFRAMDTKREDRKAKNIRSWAIGFPYVNGELFSGSTECPKFTKIARSYLLHIGNLDWKKINPDIFGSMIQAVADEDERSALGMHYTSVPNILKVLNPLFLDDLRAQLEEAGDNGRKLLNLRKRLARIRVFDPACGSGNFLVIAYKQMREIEAEINKRRGEGDRPTEIPLTNFRGIELRDFSCEIARLALIIAEYQCDVIYRGHKLAIADFLPLSKENWITRGNALQLEWLSVCPPTGTGVRLHSNDLFSTPLHQSEIDFENEGGETYICGNPPYLGSTWQSKEQKSDLQAIFKDLTKSWKSLDYVAGWFMKAAQYGRHTNAASAFVSTNSICQGQQVPILWPLIFNTSHEISFAHTSFKWNNLASHNAGVTVVIVGISNRSSAVKRLFSAGENGEIIEKKASKVNPYLIASENIIVNKSSKPKCDISEMKFGNKSVDGGNLLLTISELNTLNLDKAQRQKIVRRFYGSSEFIRGNERYALWIEDKNLQEALLNKEIEKRIHNVKDMRLSSTDKGANEMAKKPYQFREMNYGHTSTLIVPRVSSETRFYLPVGLLNNQSVVGDSAFALFDAPLWNLALIASRVHLVWIATVCGKLKTDFRYSNTLGWNTFPVPTLTAKNKEDLTRSAEEILIARERHFPATIADLYDSKAMPEDLRHAHDRNDEVLERIYIGRRFKNDTERLEKLFDLYTQMTTKAKNS
ncbi:class I SAM-dependent DNA methyltransferase [Pontibacter virosus]|uniref:site-specific DNA-methyltransferase (adenine-specific) n=1 Tax=Pontibacter virosus TaxID=1765052 RepID=A0A2U1B4S1_9BACT|nr:DNA methyltransferase [Pontibacter virosus]PVY43675.1 type II restriction/modification system DNA methylase subunit YeeA [Pontibacter virosus]